MGWDFYPPRGIFNSGVREEERRALRNFRSFYWFRKQRLHGCVTELPHRVVFIVHFPEYMRS